MERRRFGRYHLGEQLGRGGMATVFRARDPDFDREVAIKVLPQDLLDNPEFRSRFQREARSIASLEHRAIVPVYDIGEEHGQPFLVMRYMPGGTLAARLAGGPRPKAEYVAVIRRVASALEEAHRRGMVHRDIKPGNILFDSYGEAYLSDFGIVKWSQAATTLTGAGIIGTPAYMSPEQSEGRSEVGPAADIYALGVVLFQMVTGRLPFEADTPIAMALQHMQQAVPRLAETEPSAPDGLQAVVDRAMAKRPQDRFPTAGEMAQALEAAALGAPRADADIRVTTPGSAGGQARPSPPKTLATPTLRAPRQRTAVLRVLAAVVGVGITAGAVILVPRLLALVRPSATGGPPAIVSSATSRPLPATPVMSSTAPPLPSATSPPSGIRPEDSDRVGLVWSADVAGRRIPVYLAWSPRGDVIAISDRSLPGVSLWDAGLGVPAATLRDPSGVYGVGSLAWSPDGSRLAAQVDPDPESVSGPWDIVVWRASDEQVSLRFSPRHGTCAPQWSPDGRSFSCGTAMYAAESGDVLWDVPGSFGLSAFSPSGSLVALGGVGGDVHVFDAATGAGRFTLPPHTLSITGLAWSELDVLASGAFNGELHGWPRASLSVERSSPAATADTAGIFSMEWSPDGQLLLTAHLDHRVRLWDQDLRLLRELEHGGVVVGVSWAPDGWRFASTAQDGVLRVWGVVD